MEIRASPFRDSDLGEVRQCINIKPLSWQAWWTPQGSLSSLPACRRHGGESHTPQMRPLSPGGKPGRKEPHLLSPARSQVWCQDPGTHDPWPSEQPWRVGSITSIPQMRKQRHRGVKRPEIAQWSQAGLKPTCGIQQASHRARFFFSLLFCPDLWQGPRGLHPTLLHDGQRHGGPGGWDPLLRLVEWRRRRPPAQPVSPTHWMPWACGPRCPAQVGQLLLLRRRWPAAAVRPAVVSQGQHPEAASMGPIPPLQGPVLPHCGVLREGELQVRCSCREWGPQVGPGHTIRHLLNKLPWGFSSGLGFTYALGFWRPISTPERVLSPLTEAGFDKSE